MVGAVYTNNNSLGSGGIGRIAPFRIRLHLMCAHRAASSRYCLIFRLVSRPFCQKRSALPAPVTGTLRLVRNTLLPFITILGPSTLRKGAGAVCGWLSTAHGTGSATVSIVKQNVSQWAIPGH
ncbi:MAG: hypothetical protein NVS2B15_12620 [Pseudarthrobacter sp.]